MANVVAYKEHRQFGNSIEIVEIEYDFAKDAGATGALNLLKVKEAMVLVDAFTKVDTTFTSGGSATLIWGRTGDTDACLALAGGAVANLTAGAVIVGDAAARQVKMAADDVLLMTIGTAAMTAGKCRFVAMLQRFS
jgi:hypothetical protein